MQHTKWIPGNGRIAHSKTCSICGEKQTEKCFGGTASYFKKAVCEICNEPYGELRQDTIPPTGEISLGQNKWKSLLNTITFGLFFKDTQDLTITAAGFPFKMRRNIRSMQNSLTGSEM